MSEAKIPCRLPQSIPKYDAWRTIQILIIVQREGTYQAIQKRVHRSDKLC